MFDSIIMLRFAKAKVAKEEFLGAKKTKKKTKTVENWNVDVEDIVISRLMENGINSMYFAGYFNEVIIPVLILSKMIGYVWT